MSKIIHIDLFKFLSRLISNFERMEGQIDKANKQTVIFYETEKKYDAKDLTKREMKFENSKLFQTENFQATYFSSFGNKKIRGEKSGKIRRKLSENDERTKISRKEKKNIKKYLWMQKL